MEEDPLLQKQSSTRTGYASFASKDRGPRSGPAFHAASIAVLVFLPWLMFVVVTCLFTLVLYTQWLPWAADVICLMLCAFSFIINTRNTKGPMYLYLGFLGLAAVFFGTIIGCWLNANYTSSYGRLKDRVTYTNVLPTDPAASHDDAGLISFTETTKVDLLRITGQKDEDGHTYCVAPILDDTVQDRAEYWAVGVDCCGSTDDFHCGDVEGPHVKSGIVMSDSDSIFANNVYDKFYQASEQAAAFYRMTNAKRPVFVHWMEDPQEAQDYIWHCAVIGLVLALAISLLFHVLVGTALHGMTAYGRK